MHLVDMLKRKAQHILSEILSEKGRYKVVKWLNQGCVRGGLQSYFKKMQLYLSFLEYKGSNLHINNQQQDNQFSLKM